MVKEEEGRRIERRSDPAAPRVGRCAFSRAPAHPLPPDHIAHIVGHQQRAVRANGNAHRPPIGGTFVQATGSPSRMSRGGPAGRPFANGTKTTL